MPEIILIRGVPGSGKNHLAITEFPNHVLCEADQFFELNGVYDHNKIQEAHRWCQNKARKALARGNNVVVANTLIRRWEITPYMEMGYPIKIIEATGNYKNVHGVPDAIVEKMRQDFEDIGDPKPDK